MKKIVFYIALFCGAVSFSQTKDEQMREVERHVSQGYQDAREGNFNEAEANYRTAIGKDEKHTVAAYNLGELYYKNDKNDEALNRFSQAAEIAETKSEKHKAYHNLGNAMMNQKNYSGAVEAYKNALRNNPNDDETRYNLALAKKMLEENPDDEGGGGDNQDQEDQQQQDQNQEDKEDQQENKDNQEGDQEDESDQGEEKEDDSQGDDQKDKGKPEEQDNNEENQQPPQPKEGQLSPEQIQSLLEAMNNEEKKVQEKMNLEKQKGTPAKSEKDW